MRSLILCTWLFLTGAVVAVATSARAEHREAPIDEYGALDSVSVLTENTGNGHWRTTVYLSNDENLAAITLPFRWEPRGVSIRLDSAGYSGTRTSYFAVKTFYPDTAAQTILLGLISDLGTGLPPLDPGRGVIAHLYFTVPDGSDFTVRVDTAFIRPHNVLQMVTPDIRAILPAFRILSSGGE